MTEPNAKVIKDSISPDGVRLTTVEVTMHRFCLSELNTHRNFSRNSASSRAIPITKTLDRVLNDCAWPSVWACEQPGMQGGDELEGQDLWAAQTLWANIRDFTSIQVENYVTDHPDKSTRLHKSLLNRLLEPFMWHMVIITSTEWDNFWRLRCSPLAMPEMRLAAEAMHAAYEASTPSNLQYGDWHLPYIDAETFAAYGGLKEPLKKISVARCARVSYLTHDGKRDPNEDIAMYERLRSADPPHASPFEHVATPYKYQHLQNPPGNFRGWQQLRHLEGLG